MWDAVFASGVPRGVLTAAAMSRRLSGWDAETAYLRAAKALVGMPDYFGVEGLCELVELGWGGAVGGAGGVGVLLESLGRGKGGRDARVCGAVRR